MDIYEHLISINATNEEEAKLAINELKKISQLATDRIVDLAIEYGISVSMGRLFLDLGAQEEIKGCTQDEDGNWIHPKYGLWIEAYEYEQMEANKGRWMSSSDYC